MKVLHLFLLIMGMASLNICAEKRQDAYLREFEAFQNSPEYKRMFAEGTNESIKRLQKDVDIFKALTPLQRLLRFAFLMYDLVLVTPETMPQLYSFIDTLCKKSNIATPTVFIALDEGIYNAAASKLFKSTGAIVIFQRVLKEASDMSLEGIMAHEIGHIKYNHVNKSLLILMASVAAAIGTESLLENLWIDTKSNAPSEFYKKASLSVLQNLLILILPSLIINKRFEKEADAFACENGYAHGMIEAFESFNEHVALADSDVAFTTDKINASKKSISLVDYAQLKVRLGLVKMRHAFNKGYRWLNHNTPWGAHPSPDARIEAAQEYLATH